MCCLLSTIPTADFYTCRSFFIIREERQREWPEGRGSLWGGAVFRHYQLEVGHRCEVGMRGWQMSAALVMSWGAIHQYLRIILKLRILVLLPVSTLPYLVQAKNHS
jgi:hypothetical protein